MTVPKAFSNAVVAARLERLADLLELSGANPFRVRAYRTAAATVEAHPERVGELVARGAPLTDLKGVGKDIAAAIAALYATGAIPAFDELAREVPLGLLDVVQVPGVGPKRALTLWKELAVTDLDDLERVAAAGKIAALAGFGAKTQAKVLAGVAQVRRRAGRRRLGDVDAWLQPLLAALRAVPGVRRIEVAGSVRRGRATIGDVDLLALADDGAALMTALREHPDVAEVLGSGATKTSVRLEGDLQVDLRVVPEASFGAAWQYFTGSKAHNVALRQRAIDRGLRLNEYGVFRDDECGGEAEAGADPQRGERVAGADEAEVYAALGLEWIPPELREDRGEVAQAAEGRLPRLLTRGDLLGDLHLHSTWSDGKGGVRAMRAACAAKGYVYHGLTDHSQALKMTGGLDAAKLERQWAELDQVAAEEAEAGAPMPTLLRGLEVDILKDGALDLDEAWLARLDLVIVSVHGHFDLPEAQQTARIVAALQHPQVNVFAHPTGRLLGERDGYAVDLDAVFEAAAAHGVAIECNASPYRLDLGDVELARAVAAGCTVVVSSDAHSVAGLDVMPYGVATARRAGLGPDQVLNAWGEARVRAFLAKRDASDPT
ncbi:MAG: DNA polymerase/3'-5' exonuclease PolX [Trueperaceae bacterium]